MTTDKNFSPSGFAPYNQTIPSRFLLQASRCPESSAVADDLRNLTYGELVSVSGACACAILDRVGSEEIRVCILAPQNVDAVVGMLGVLQAGQCFVPLLPQEEDAYLSYLWENSEASLILCDPALADRAAQICGDAGRVIEIGSPVPGENHFEYFDQRNPESLSAIMYTSGSTGRPKGVMTTGRAIFGRSMQHVEMAAMTPSDRQASVVPWQFAASFPDIFGPLMVGASVYLYDNSAFGIDRLNPWIEEHGITLLKLPAAVLGRFIEKSAKKSLETVRYVYASGGAVNAGNARRLLDILSDGAVLMHGFGSTETNFLAGQEWRRGASALEALSPEEILPAGFPVADKTLQILDDRGHPVPDGEEGELVAIGEALFTGYWREPDMTGQCLKILPDGRKVYHTGDLAKLRADGCLEIVGRKGHRVKIRGLRIDLEAVESILQRLPYVHSAAAVAFSAPGKDAYLVAYLEMTEGEPATTTQIRNDLKQTAPQYMIPSRFVILETLPRTASGKINRTALPAPGRARPALLNVYEPPRSDLEKRLAEIWADVLDLDEVGIHDPFLELGGDSLLALELEARLSHELNITEPISRLLLASTIAKMAQVIENRETRSPLPAHVSLPLLLRLTNLLRRFKAKGISLSPSLEAVSPSYEMFMRFQKFWISLPTSALLYRRKIRIFRQWLELTNQLDQAEALSELNMLANVWFVGREFLMAQKSVFDRWVKIAGKEHLEKTASDGKGAVIVFPHTRVFHACIRERICSGIFPESYFLNVNDLPRVQELKTILVVDRIKEARSVLARGGAVWLAGDGMTGAVKAIVTKYGRSFPFRSGAADLAAQSGAPLILAFPGLGADGTVTVEFLDPLKSKGKGPTARADVLLSQYAEIYVDRWPKMLPFMTALWQRLRLEGNKTTENTKRTL